jgi:hypothetical protein
MESTEKKGRIGRPQIRLESLVTIPTRTPEALLRYMKAIYPFRYASLTAMYKEMLTRFLDTRPWEEGLDWRKPKGRVEKSGGQIAATGWIQVNVQTTKELKEKVIAVAKTNGVTNAVVVYTAMFWWAMYIMPAKTVKSGKAQ